MHDDILIIASGDELPVKVVDLPRIAHLVYRCNECEGDTPCGGYYHPKADPDTPEERNQMNQIRLIVNA